ncbi:MAG: BtpA/SgcQ family protein [Bradymonadales bacterium]
MRKTWIPGGFIGVIHLPALPGDPLWSMRSIEEIEEFALKDASALAEGKADAMILENFGSTPFPKGNASQAIPPQHTAIMSIIARSIKRRFPDIPLGINCLRNDAKAALGIALAADADFIRVNVHTGAYITDQGIIEGDAYETLRFRQLLGAEHIAILADVLVKHAKPLAPISASEATTDTLERGLADGVIVTGSGTGQAVDRRTLEEVHEAAGHKPVLIGSGAKHDTLSIYAPFICGAIVGTSLKYEGKVENHVDPERVKRMAATFEQLVKNKQTKESKNE